MRIGTVQVYPMPTQLRKLSTVQIGTEIQSSKFEPQCPGQSISANLQNFGSILSFLVTVTLSEDIG